MNTQLTLRKNSDSVNQYAKQIAQIVLNRKKELYEIPNMIFLDQDDLRELGISKIRHLEVYEVVVLDHGWLVASILLEPLLGIDFGSRYRNEGRRLQGILNSKSNKMNCNRSTYVRCKSAVKGQRLFEIKLTLNKNDYEENFLIINHSGKIIPCQYAEMYSHNWNGNSPEALELIGSHESVFEEFEEEW